MTDPTLYEFAAEAEDLASRIESTYPDDRIAGHAAVTIRDGAAGLRRAVVKANERAERAEAKAERLAEWQEAQVKKAEIQKYDPVVHQMAKDRGISLDEAQAVQDAARTRYREAMRKGSIAEQMAKLEPK